MRLSFSDTLKCLLVDEWENITKKQLVHSRVALFISHDFMMQILVIPARKSVSQVMEHYKAWVKDTNPFDVRIDGASLEADDDPFSLHLQVVEEVVDGVVEYFNLSLGSLLLYSTERLQYKDILSGLPPSGRGSSSADGNGQELSDIYGAHHLLRLFTKLPEMISKLPMAPGTVALLREHFSVILKYLELNASELFSDHDFCNLAPDQISQLKSIH
jgi:mortality factor 4-like protein 1